MRKITLILCLGLLGILSVLTWQLFELQVFSQPFASDHAARPAIIRPIAIASSPAQQLMANKTGYLTTHDFAADETFVPRPTKYVRLEFLASAVEKPFQVFFISDRAFPVNTFRLEYNVLVSPTAAMHVLHDSQSLSCLEGSADMAIRNDLFDVRYRDEDNLLRRCLISKKDGCAFLKRSRLYLQSFARPGHGVIIEMADLERRIGCTPTLFDWGLSQK